MNDRRGQVNAHTHLYSGLAPLGMPAPDPAPKSFLQILQSVWWKLDRALDEKSLRASARYYLSQAKLAGTAALVDHHESPNFIEGSLEVLADACQEMGMRAVLCYGATERNGGLVEGRAGLAECRRFLQENDRPLVKGCVGLHASFTVSDELLLEAGQLCREFSAVLHVHLAEGLEDVEDAQHRGWPGPLARLLHFRCLPKGSILAHGVHLDREQVQRCAERELWLVQNPRSNKANGVGYPKALGASSRVALGTDGFPSDMAEEQRILLEEAAYVEKTSERVGERLANGWRLIAERFAGELGSNDAADSLPKGVDVESIRAEAEEEAQRLWERMSAQ